MCGRSQPFDSSIASEGLRFDVDAASQQYFCETAHSDDFAAQALFNYLLHTSTSEAFRIFESVLND